MSTSRVNEQNTTITPPPPPDQNSGYYSEGYWQLLKSLPVAERNRVLTEIKTSPVIERSEKLEKELAVNKLICTDSLDTRTTFLASILCLQQKKISVNQLASLHLLDSAIKTLYTFPLSYLVHNYCDGNGQQYAFSFFSVPKATNYPINLKYLHYTTGSLPTLVSAKGLPQRFDRTLLSRFFNFTDYELAQFSAEMDQAPVSERYFSTLAAPEFGCWSAITSRIQKYLSCMKVLDWHVQTSTGCVQETIMLVPSFSMFQAAINAKAKQLKRRPIQLIPTYGYLDATTYARYKSIGHLPLTMYMPEQQISQRYSLNEGKFRSTIDGHPKETAFAGAIHDVYHGLREMAMHENIANARFRLASIAENHPNNIISYGHRPISEILIDGELIHSYKPELDTIFEDEHRSAAAEIFGDLFKKIGSDLHPDLKRAFIADMVQNKADWEECFQLTKTDLLSKEQEIYDEIESELLLTQISRVRLSC